MIIIIPIVLLIFIILVLKFLKIESISKKIILVYSVIMCSWIFVSMLNPVGLYEVNNYTYLLLFVNVVCVIIGLIAICLIKFKNKNVENSNNKSLDKIVNSKYFMIFLLIVTAIIIYYFIKYIIIISDLPISQIRIASFTLLFDSAFETLFYIYIVSGIISILSILFSILLVNKKILNKVFGIICFDIILYSLIGFGRMTIFTILVLILISFLITRNKKITLNLKQFLNLLYVAVIIFVFFTAMIFVRMRDENKSFFENLTQSIYNQSVQIFEYFCGSIRTLDIFVEEGFEEFPDNTYIRATLSGIDEIILYPFKGIGLEIDSFNNIAVDIMSKTYSVGKNTHYYNAFYTCVMNYYLDLGISGVIIYSILHGVFIGLIIKNYLKNKNLISLMLLIYVVKNLFFTVLNWQYQSGSVTFILIILIGLNIINNFKNRRSLKK